MRDRGVKKNNKRYMVRKKRGDAKKRFVNSLKTIVKTTSIVFAVTFTMLGAYLAYEAVEESGYFNVQELSVSGTMTLDQETVTKLIGPVLGRNILKLDLKSIGERLEAHPWLKRVTARRELPGKLVIDIVERRPVAVAAIGARWLIDADGVLLEKKGNGKWIGLPVLFGLKVKNKNLKAGFSIDRNKIYQAINAVSRLSGYRLFGRQEIYGVDLSNIEHMEIMFKGDGLRVIVPRAEWTDVAERLLVVDHILRKKSGTVKSIDLTFPDKVIVTYPEV